MNIQCPHHPQYILSQVVYDSNTPNRGLYCQYCITQNNLQNYKMIPLGVFIQEWKLGYMQTGSYSINAELNYIKRQILCEQIFQKEITDLLLQFKTQISNVISQQHLILQNHFQSSLNQLEQLNSATLYYQNILQNMEQTSNSAQIILYIQELLALVQNSNYTTQRFNIINPVSQQMNSLLKKEKDQLQSYKKRIMQDQQTFLQNLQNNFNNQTLEDLQLQGSQVNQINQVNSQSVNILNQSQFNLELRKQNFNLNTQQKGLRQKDLSPVGTYSNKKLEQYFPSQSVSPNKQLSPISPTTNEDLNISNITDTGIKTPQNIPSNQKPGFLAQTSSQKQSITQEQPPILKQYQPPFQEQQQNQSIYPTKQAPEIQNDQEKDQNEMKDQEDEANQHNSQNQKLQSQSQQFEFKIQSNQQYEEFESGHFQEIKPRYTFKSGDKSIYHPQSQIPEKEQESQSKSKISESSQSNVNKAILTLSSKSIPQPKTTKLFSFRAHEKRISSMQQSKQVLFSGSFDKTIKVWDKNTGKMQQVLEGHVREVIVLKYYKAVLASGGADKIIRIWKECPQWQTIHVLKSHSDLLVSLEFLDESQLLSSSEDKTLRLWDINKGVEKRCLKFDFTISSILIKNKNCFLGGLKLLFIYSVPDLKQLRIFQAHNQAITRLISINFKNIEFILTISKEGAVKMWDIDKMQVWRDFKDDYEISDIVFLSQYNFLICGLTNLSAEGKLCVWSLDSFKKIKEFYENGSGAGAILWDENIEQKGGILWVGHENKKIESYKFG